MALKKDVQNYEILIRFNEDGKIGAHLQTLTVVKDGANVLSAKPDDPVSMTLSELQEKVAAWTEDDMYVPPVADEVAE